MFWMGRSTHSASSVGFAILFAIAVTVVALLAQPVPALAGEAIWRVSDIKGEARMRTGSGQWQALKRSQDVPADSRIETGKTGRLLLVRPGDSIAVSPNSTFNVPKDAGGVSTRKNPLTQIVQKTGTLLFKITTRPEKPFGVKTPYLAAVIKGTTFTVSVRPDNAALHVSKGAVQVRSILSGESVLVRPGQTAAVGPLNGGKLQMMGVVKPGSGAHGQKKAEAGTADDKAGAPGAADTRLAAAKRNSTGLRIHQPVGAKRVNVNQASRGLLVEIPAESNRSNASVGQPSDLGVKKAVAANGTDGGRSQPSRTTAEAGTATAGTTTSSAPQAATAPAATTTTSVVAAPSVATAPTVSTTTTVSTAPTLSSSTSTTASVSTAPVLSPTVDTTATISTAPTLSPTVSTTASVSTAPVLSPTVSTTASVSTAPVLSPTVSTTASVSTAPVLSPTVSTTPTVSTAPVVSSTVNTVTSTVSTVTSTLKKSLF